MNRLKETREKMGLKQIALANACGVSQSAYSNWESGRHKPDFRSLRIISERLGVSTDYLLGMTDEPIKSQEIKSKKEPKKELNSQDEIWELREELRRNPDLRMLFSATKNATADDLRRTVAILNALKGNDDQ